MTEQEIILGCIRLNKQCQRILFDQYAGRFMNLCLRYANNQMEAEDMMQEGFISIFKNIEQYKNDGPFGAWMRKIMVNAALSVLRKKKVQFIDIDQSEAYQKSIDTYTYSNLGEEDLMKLINALPNGYKVVFNLSIIEGFSHEEIAKMLDIQPATSRSQLVKARKMLQQQIIHLEKIAV
ncbi:MAG: RNA polymerase sigma factor [Chitinophagaceae bacterium]